MRVLSSRRPWRMRHGRATSLSALVLSLSFAACGDPVPTPAAPDDNSSTNVSASSALGGSRAFIASSSSGLPSLPSFSSLQDDERRGFQKAGTFFRTDVGTAGVGGLRNVGSAVLTLNGVSGTISRAYLYWHAVTRSNDLNVLGTIQVDGQPVVGTNIGQSNDNCWGYTNSQAWVADITTLVRAKGGSGTYGLTQMGNVSTLANSNGASIVVFYQDGNPANDRDVVLYHGNDSNIPNVYDDDGWNVTLNDIVYAGGNAALELHVADGQSFSDANMLLNGVLLPNAGGWNGNTVPAANFGPNSDGRLWDIKEFNITSYLSVGNNNLSLVLDQVGADCLALVTALVKLPGGAAPTPTLIMTPTTVSLSLSRTVNVYLTSNANFNAVSVLPATTRMYIGTNAVGAPVARRGAAYLTSVGDYNGDGRQDRLLTFNVSDLVAAGLTTTSTSFTVADRSGAFLFESQANVAPTIVP